MSTRKKSRREILDEMTRNMILDAASEILGKEGLGKLTMQRVAQEAGLAKGTLYLYFKDKQTLLQVTVERGFAAYLEEVERFLNSDMDAAEKIKTFVRHNISILERNREILEEMDINSALFEQIGWRNRNSPYWTMVDRLSTVFDEGIRQGIFRPQNSEFAACFVIDTLATFRHWHQMGRTADSRELDIRMLSDIIFSGIRK